MLAQSLLIFGVVFRLRCWNGSCLCVFLSVFGECANKDGLLPVICIPHVCIVA
jgi:hypothetical protein